MVRIAVSPRLFPTLAAALLVCASLACHAAPAPKLTPVAQLPDRAYFSGGDGSSADCAIFFPNARSSSDGVPLERKWIAERFPGYRKASQRLIEHEGRLYDVLVVTTAAGEPHPVWFDMTTWFGRLRAQQQ